MNRAAIIFTFLLYQVISSQAKCKFLDQSKRFIRMNYTLNQSLDDVDFGSLVISGFGNLENFFCNCNLEPNDKVEFSIEYKSKKMWKLLGKPFDIMNVPGEHLDVKSINVDERYFTMSTSLRVATLLRNTFV